MRVRVMADYGTHPLWREGPSGVANISPEMIDLPDDLAAGLRSWSAEYDLTLNIEDPLLSGFADAADEQTFNETGLALARAVAGELGSGADVTYFDMIKSVLVRFRD